MTPTATPTVRFSGTRLRSIRRELGLRPEQVAVAIGRSVEMLSGYERNRHVPSVTTMCVLAAALRVDIAELFEDVE